VLDDVDEQEQQDPDRQGVEERVVPRRHDANARQRQPEEDRQPGDRPEDHRFLERHLGTPKYIRVIWSEITGATAGP